MRELTVREAEDLLTEYAAVMRSRDDRVRAALAAGLSKHRIHRLSGLGRMTVERILSADGPGTAREAGNP